MPNYSSVDGTITPPFFQAEVLPYIFQTPIIPKIGIMMASATEAIAQGRGARNKETLAIKADVLCCLNSFLKQDFKVICYSALLIVTEMTVMEVSTHSSGLLWWLMSASANKRTVLLG